MKTSKSWPEPCLVKTAFLKIISTNCLLKLKRITPYKIRTDDDWVSVNHRQNRKVSDPVVFQIAEVLGGFLSIEVLIPKLLGLDQEGQLVKP